MIPLFMIVLAGAVALSGATVKGVVRDSVTGEPIEGVLIVATSRAELSAADGTFEFAEVKPGRHYFSAHHKGYVWTWETTWARPYVDIGAGEIKELVFRLDPVAAITGYVRTETGEPIPKAKIECYFCGLPGVETGFDGRFVIERAVPGKHSIWVQVPPGVRSALGVGVRAKHVELTVSPGQKIEGIDIRVPFARVVSVSGQVVDPATDEPVTEGVIQLTEFEFLAPNSDGQEPAKLHRGTFRFDGVLPGSYILHFHRKSVLDSIPSTQRIEVGPDGIENLRVELPPVARLTGKVKHPAHPDTDTKVHFEGMLPERRYPATLTQDVAVSRGRFVMEGLTPGVWRPRVSLSRAHWQVGDEFPPPLRIVSMRQSGRELKGEVEIFGGENPEIEIDAVPMAAIRGVVVDRNGRPVPLARVSVTHGKEQDLTRSEGDGEFVWHGGPGDYEFRAEGPAMGNGQGCVSDPVKVRLADTNVPVRLVLCP